MILLAGAQSVQISCFRAFSPESLFFCILIVALILSIPEALSFSLSHERVQGSVSTCLQQTDHIYTSIMVTVVIFANGWFDNLRDKFEKMFTDTFTKWLSAGTLRAMA